VTGISKLLKGKRDFEEGLKLSFTHFIFLTLLELDNFLLALLLPPDLVRLWYGLVGRQSASDTMIGSGVLVEQFTTAVFTFIGATAVLVSAGSSLTNSQLLHFHSLVLRQS